MGDEPNQARCSDLSNLRDYDPRLCRSGIEQVVVGCLGADNWIFSVYLLSSIFTSGVGIGIGPR